MPACGLQCGLAVALYGPSSSTQAQYPRGADDTSPPQGQPHQAGSRGGEEIKARGTSRGAHDASHDDQGQAGADLRRVLVSPFVQRGQAQAKVSGKGYHFGATRPRLAGRQDGGHRGAQDGVITSAFRSRRPPLVRKTCTRCSPSKWPIDDALPAQLFGERPRASINRASHHRVGIQFWGSTRERERGD